MTMWMERTIKGLALALHLLGTSSAVSAFSSPESCFQNAMSSRKVLPQQSIRRVAAISGRRALTSPRLHHHHAIFGSALHMTLDLPRGGGIVPIDRLLSPWIQSPETLFNVVLVGLAATTAIAKALQHLTSRSASSASTTVASSKTKPRSIQSLQLRFLVVFWLLRCADWLQGPYFYEVYASKVFHGAQASMSLVSNLFLTGFAATALFGPLAGRMADQYGRKKATLAFTVFYALGALSTKSPVLLFLFMGRVLSGIGTSLLFSAPESWLVGEAQTTGDDPNGQYLGEIFGTAYSGDSIVAILAGQMAALAASQRGTTGPFELSTVFLMAGGLMAALLWKENVASTGSSDPINQINNTKPSIYDALQVVKADPKIMLVGGVQSLFEAAMYIFVLQWPPAVAQAISKAFAGVSGEVVVPYGTVFSCFMACCLLGATIFGQLAKMRIATEKFTFIMLTVAALSMATATWTIATTMNLAAAVASFFVFEACVGMYFPSIGSLRSRYIPDSHRSVIMNLFGIPLNALVVSVFLSINSLGLIGALSISSVALGVAAICMMALLRKVETKSST